MRWSVIISVFFHAAIIVGAVTSLPTYKPEDPFKNPPMVIDLVKIEEDVKAPDAKEEVEKEIVAKADVANEKIAEATKDPPKVPEKEQEEIKKDVTQDKNLPLPKERKLASLPKQEELVRDPQPIIKKEVKQDPDPVLPTLKPKARPDLQPKLIPIPKEKPKPKKDPPAQKKLAKLTPVKEPKPKQKKKKKKKSVLNEISMLLDKRATSGAIKSSRTSKDSTALAARAIRGKKGPKMTVDEISAIRQQIEKCWSVPAGARGAKNLVVEVQIWLNKDGSLSKSPKIVDTSRMTKGGFYKIAAESARRAVIQCAPLKGLPEKKYEHWRAITLQFDPREMLGG